MTFTMSVSVTRMIKPPAQARAMCNALSSKPTASRPPSTTLFPALKEAFRGLLYFAPLAPIVSSALDLAIDSSTPWPKIARVMSSTGSKTTTLR